MRYRFTFFMLMFCFSTAAQVDSSLAKKITVSGFCLCKTTLADLQSLDRNLKQVDVEEMQFGKKCAGGGDSRFVNGKGYHSANYPGIIFQKDQDEDYISKIRLEQAIIGALPDGTPIDMNNLQLKNIISIYHEPAFKWSTRDCSDYWTYSNDTISFYVKIDPNKIPQYPLDEAYYLNRKVDAIDVVISCYRVYNQTKTFSLFSPDEPMYFIDSIRTNKAFIVEAYQPSEIASISIYKDSNAIKIAGKEAKNGLIYITTKSFARLHYWSFFKTKSPDYAKSVPDLKTEKKVTYILNDKVLESNYESDLFNINDNDFIELIVIDKKRLKSDYNISGGSLGVVIKTASK